MRLDRRVSFQIGFCNWEAQLLNVDAIEVIRAQSKRCPCHTMNKWLTENRTPLDMPVAKWQYMICDACALRRYLSWQSWYQFQVNLSVVYSVD